MSYELEWHPKALKEWKKLDPGIRAALKEKLLRRLSEPRVPKAALHGDLADCYKIKHESYRLIYQVLDRVVTVKVLAVGTREGFAAYKSADDRTG